MRFTYDIDGSYNVVKPVLKLGGNFEQTGDFIVNQHGFLVPVGRHGSYSTEELAEEAMARALRPALPKQRFYEFTDQMFPPTEIWPYEDLVDSLSNCVACHQSPHIFFLDQALAEEESLQELDADYDQEKRVRQLYNDWRNVEPLYCPHCKFGKK